MHDFRPIQSHYPDDELTRVLEVIGEPQFGDRVLDAFGKFLPAEYFVCHILSGYGMAEVVSAGRGWAARSSAVNKQIYHDARRQMMSAGGMVHIEVTSLGAGQKQRGEEGPTRVLISARRGGDRVCLSVITREPFSAIGEDMIERLRGFCWFLVAAMLKHSRLLTERPNLVPAITSLEEIVSCMAETTSLSRRETEVCARIIYGQSSCGIALDLGIGKESVMTYRKRAYCRLGIASQRELLVWYLGMWTQMKAVDRPVLWQNPA